ncbi:MAG: bifunctional diguanylate cyclase/phosphodiesterase, partial [Spongiibacteraceae bacterium]|nr:bifunctional diguanylate cyclase/phosphodiesterase [Spongiibacteraceae bacterium]
KRVDKKSAEQNLYDPLTGSSNRVSFRRTMNQTIERAKTHKVPLALLLINLDGFKKVNESYGCEAGDLLVKTMADRLVGCVRKSDNIARIGGDEFTLVLDDSRTEDDIALVAKKVIDVLSAPFTIAACPLMVSCSIGIATFPSSGATTDDLLQHANTAMLEAKSQRGSQYRFYTEELNADARYRLNMEADLRKALRANEFEMYYQPRVALEGGDTAGMEALIRWRHPTRGMVSPKEFIPIAEECGLIVPIGYWVIQQACKDMVIFDLNTDSRLDIAINLSFKQLQDSMFVDTATRIIKQSGVDATRLEFELTETAIMSNYQQTYEGMMALSQLGVTFSLDDFGTGFSSFAHIQRLPISALKVDRSFIRSVEKNDDDAIIVKAIINLAHSLRLQVIAEGVETLGQVQFLWQNHCDQVQGYYFSPAIPASDILLMINQRATVAI